uniref:CCHC-type domain-containing protein n=1 Tax=Tanacetum cinerariifolium TaxID=118510 RepID=A0A6L2NVT9_TANCI|nr:hypothetical protein [Tanacetum cinerariifolium]
MTTPNVTSSTDSQMHNDIMEAGSRDRPPMLAPGRYPQWRLRFLRYVDTRPNGEALRKCILNGPYKPTTILVQAVEATDDSPAVHEHTTVETPTNMSPENKAYFLAEKEAIHLIPTGIRDDIYSTVDACQTTQEMWEAIERLQQGESLNIQDVKTNLFWEFNKFTSHDGETMESYYTRFYKLMNEMIRNNLTVTTMHHKLDEVSYYKLFDILKQYQNEVNELRAKKLARNANPLALVATAQVDRDPYYQSSRSHRSQAPSSKPSIPTRSHTSTRHKYKEIAKPITPPSETASEEDSDPEQAQRDKDIQKNLALIAKYFKKVYKPTNNNLRTSSNSKNKNVDTTLWYKNDDHSGQFGTQRTVNVAVARENVGSKVVQQSGIQCFNCKEYGHFTKECRKPKRVKDSTYHKEKMLLCKQAEQATWLRSRRFPQLIQAQIQSQWNSNTCLVETDDSNVTPDSPDMCEDDIQNEQNDVESDDEHVALANLIDNLKLDVDENKKTQKQLKKTCLMPLAIKTQSDSLKFVHELKQEMHADLKYVESLKKEIDELESDKTEFSNMYDVILQECVSKDVMCSYLMSLSNLDALEELQCMYLHKVKECDCLAQKLSKQTESISKKVHTKLLQRFAKVKKHSISLEIALQNCKEQDLIFQLIALKLWPANIRFVNDSCRGRRVKVSIPDSLSFLRCLR